MLNVQKIYKYKGKELYPTSPHNGLFKIYNYEELNTYDATGEAHTQLGAKFHLQCLPGGQLWGMGRPLILHLLH